MNVTLPPGAPKPLDRQVLVQLLLGTVHSLYESVRGSPLPTYSRALIRPEGESVKQEAVVYPDYRRAFSLLWDRQLWRTNAFGTLSDYLWNQGACKRSFEGPSPDRASWELTLLMEFTLEPLLRTLDEHALRTAVESGTFEPWLFAGGDLEHAVEAEVEAQMQREKPASKRRFHYRAYSPLLSSPGILGGPVAQSPGISLIPWTPLEASMVGSRHRIHLDMDLTVSFPPLSNVAIELDVSLSPRGADTQERKESVLAEVIYVVDLIKWGLTVTSADRRTPSEGFLACEWYDGKPFALMRRENRTAWPLLVHEPGQAERCSREVKKFLRWANSHKDLKTALWHFGRSCVAPLARDAIVEAGIGLDSLISSGRDAGYKFALHGASLLADVGHTPVELFNVFEALWKFRSQQLHGKVSKKVKEELQLANRLLAKTMSAILDMAQESLLDLEGFKSIYQAVERYVLIRACSRANQ